MVSFSWDATRRSGPAERVGLGARSRLGPSLVPARSRLASPLSPCIDYLILSWSQGPIFCALLPLPAAPKRNKSKKVRTLGPAIEIKWLCQDQTRTGAGPAATEPPFFAPRWGQVWRGATANAQKSAPTRPHNHRPATRPALRRRVQRNNLAIERGSALLPQPNALHDARSRTVLGPRPDAFDVRVRVL